MLNLIEQKVRRSRAISLRAIRFEEQLFREQKRKALASEASMLRFRLREVERERDVVLRFIRHEFQKEIMAQVARELCVAVVKDLVKTIFEDIPKPEKWEATEAMLIRSAGADWAGVMPEGYAEIFTAILDRADIEVGAVLDRGTFGLSGVGDTVQMTVAWPKKGEPPVYHYRLPSLALSSRRVPVVRESDAER